MQRIVDEPEVDIIPTTRVLERQALFKRGIRFQQATPIKDSLQAQCPSTLRRPVHRALLKVRPQEGLKPAGSTSLPTARAGR
jgi:hypothetical protein